MDVQLLRGIIMYKRKKNQPLHQQTQLLLAAIPFGSGDKIQEACPFWAYKRFGVSNHSNDLWWKGTCHSGNEWRSGSCPYLVWSRSFYLCWWTGKCHQNQDEQICRKQYGDTLLKPYYWKPLFWSDSYFVASDSENSLISKRIFRISYGIHSRPFLQMDVVLCRFW